MAAKKTEKPTSLAIKAEKLEWKEIAMTIQAFPGSPLVVNNLRSKTNVNMMRRRLLGRSTTTKGKIRDPKSEFLAARYVDADGNECVPSHGIKLSICSALQFYTDIDLTMARARRIIQVDVGKDLTPVKFKPTKNKDKIVFLNEDYLAEPKYTEEDENSKNKPKPKKTKEPQILYQCDIEDELPDFREDVVRLQGATRAPDLRYRPQYNDWEADIVVRFPPSMITMNS